MCSGYINSYTIVFLTIKLKLANAVNPKSRNNICVSVVLSTFETQHEQAVEYVLLLVIISPLLSEYNPYKNPMKSATIEYILSYRPNIPNDTDANRTIPYTTISVVNFLRRLRLPLTGN